MNHLVKRQVIEVNLDARQDAFAIQQQIRDYYDHQVTPVLEKVFDELSADDEIIDIDRLEIDLGELGWKNNRFTLDTNEMERIVKRSLLQALTIREPGLPETRVMRRTLEENACRQWIYYMEYGILPWNVQTITAQWLEQVLHQLAIDYRLIEQTRKLIIEHAWFSGRLVREHTDPFLLQLIEVMTAKKHPDLIHQLNLHKESTFSEDNKPIHKKKQIREQVLKYFASHPEEVQLPESLPADKKIIPADPTLPVKEMIPEGIYCNCAGLVLLHPFFKHLFNHLQLLTDGIFQKSENRSKAVLLLFFVATGKTEPADHELVVPKTLCGMAPEELIEEEAMIIHEAGRAEAINMMQAAIAQWAAIGNTSIDGLREGFLNRPGKLLIRDSAPEFKIESHAIDVLLDRLPWNLQMIKFSWLKKIIRVEWR